MKTVELGTKACKRSRSKAAVIIKLGAAWRRLIKSTGGRTYGIH
jgi:hypothetical protein